ncbi:hypothetical protein DFJ74DRAFT_676810 [Hyaloraphidium curvatum]|nr:hypothetical protein DFJ74DRAFT_676810 [Hyaloraphidium curvatum]
MAPIVPYGPPAAGEVATVVRPHIPQLSDELLLSVGDTVTIQRVHDDGWATGINNVTRVTGVFPMACVFRSGGALPQ